MSSVEIENAHQALRQAVDVVIKIIAGAQKDADVKQWLEAWQGVMNRVKQVSGQPTDVCTDTVGTALLRVELEADELGLNINKETEDGWKEVNSCHQKWMHAHMNAGSHDDSGASCPSTGNDEMSETA